MSEQRREAGARRAHPGHGVCIADDCEVVLELDVLDVGPYAGDEGLDDVADVAAADAPAAGELVWAGAPGDKGHLEVDLGELGLAVAAAVLVAEAAGELVVAVDGAGADEELLWLLRGLGEGVEEGLLVRGGGSGSGVTCGDEELACALGGGLEEDGGLDLLEG